jgi:putative transposase
MKKSRYSDEQIVRILREEDSAPIAEVAKRHRASDASIYTCQLAAPVSVT